MYFFRKNREIEKDREFFLDFQFFLSHQSVGNVKIQFLSKFRRKMLLFEEVMSFSDFTDVQGRWPGFTKIVVGSLQRKAVTFEVMESEPSNFAIRCFI